MRIAVQGVPGCFSEQAALGYDPLAEIANCDDFAGIFAALEQGRADRGMVPVENTLAGAVDEAQALLRQHAVQVEAEVQLQIELCLMIHPGSGLERIQRVLSHPVALRQCGRFLGEHPGWLVTPFFDTAGSVQEVMRLGEGGSLDTAAIAGARAAEVYGASIVARGIGDRKANFTRFFVISLPARRVPEGRQAGAE